MTVLEVRVLNSPQSMKDTMQRKPLPLAPINELFLFLTNIYLFRKGDQNRLYLFWNNLDFTFGLYHWYRRVKKSQTFNKLSFYFNYLSTVTLLYFGNTQ